MLAKIEQLEIESRKLESNIEERNKWLRSVQDYSNDFVESLPFNDAFKADYSRADFFKSCDLDIGNHSMEEVLEILKNEVDQVGLNPASEGHLGYIPGGGIYPTALGDYLAAITNRYAGIYFGGPGAVRLENSLIKWMCKIIGFPDTAHGNLCSGGSIANLIAITTARDKKNISSKKIDSSVIYLTQQTHHCVHKAVKIAGLAEAQLRNIPMDANYKMDPIELSKQIKKDKKSGLTPFLIVASAGTTDTGSMDPLGPISAIAKEFNCWFHVDAAYGGFFILVDQLKHLFDGIELADSVAIDPHKGLFLSYGLGAVLIKDVEAMYQSHFYKANYMQDAQEKFTDLSPADLSPELTKHFRGLRLWLPLMLHGILPFKAGLEEKYLLTQYFYDKVQAIGFQVGPKPELSVALYRYTATTVDLNYFNKLLVEEIHRDGKVFLSSHSINGEIWLRAAILCFRTHKSTVDNCLTMLNDCVNRVKMSIS